VRSPVVVIKILISLIVIVSIPALLYIFLTGPTFRVHNVDVALENEASYGLTFPSIKENLNQKLKPFLGKFVWGIDLERVMKVVESDLRIKDAKVSRVLPNTLQISVSPYTPILNIMGSRRSQLYPVSRDGEVLPPVSAIEASDSVILRGDIFREDRELRLKAIELLLSLPEVGALSQKTISDIYYDKKKGFELRLQSS
jgi:cell division septal protein FtsQ